MRVFDVNFKIPIADAPFYTTNFQSFLRMSDCYDTVWHKLPRKVRCLQVAAVRGLMSLRTERTLRGVDDAKCVAEKETPNPTQWLRSIVSMSMDEASWVSGKKKKGSVGHGNWIKIQHSHSKIENCNCRGQLEEVDATLLRAVSVVSYWPTLERALIGVFIYEWIHSALLDADEPQQMAENMQPHKKPGLSGY